MGLEICGVIAHIIRLPLIRPYHLSFGALEAFDSLILRIQANGIEGMGEVTDCPGYFIQELKDAWKFVCTHGPELPGRDPEEALEGIRIKGLEHPFASAALMTALESLICSAKRSSSEVRRVPLLGIVQGTDKKAIIEDAKRLQRGWV